MSTTKLDVFACPLGGTRLIEASAGTGKTWNLCGLFMRLLLEQGLEVQRILVVTFTNAATAELRERIRARIVETLARLRGSGPVSADPFVDSLLARLRSEHGLADADMVLKLELALQTFDEASIFTIHGFCQRALADAALSAGMPMALELLADDSELRRQVVHDFWRRRIAADALAPALARHLLERGDTPQRYAALLDRRLGKPLAPLLWPPGIDAELALDTEALAAAHGAARTLWQTQREDILGCVLEALPRLHGGSYKRTTVERAAEGWDLLLAGDDALRADDSLDKIDLLTTARLKPNKGKDPVHEHAFFAIAQSLVDLRHAAQQALALARLRLLRDLLNEGPQALRDTKRERRLIAFDDMLFNLHQRLQGTHGAAFATTLRQRFPAALIDEFQDTDPLQFQIFDALYGGSGAPLFLVGDPKQAIYSFRQADLHTYLQARSQAVADYTLADNQRSTAPLLAGLNALFGANPRAFMLPGLDYPPVDCGARPRPLLVDRSAPRAPLQLWTLPLQPDGRPAPKPLVRQAAAAACAGEIARLLGAGRDGQVTLGGRALAAGDMAVLVRSHGQGAEMRRALSALGVGAVEHSQASVFASADAEELEQLLAAVLEPTREPLLRAAQATVLLGLDASAINASSADDAAQFAFMTRLMGYRETWLQRGVGSMLRQLMVGEGVNARLLARPDGERRLTNLLHLAECLHEAATLHPAPEALWRWLQARRSEGGGGEAAQLRLESDRNLVQIVTIHKSKGLEYPLVFCPFLWDGHAGGAAGGEGLEYHDDDGAAVIDFRELDKTTLDRVKAQRALERAAEHLRLIYVALTRAVQRCTLVVGSYRRRTAQGWSEVESGRALMHWLVAGAGGAPADWFASKRTAQDVLQAWSDFAAALAPQVGLAVLPQAAPAPLQALRPAPGSLTALVPPARLPAGWWIGSYSSLAHGARHEAAAVDHDLRLPAPEAAPAAPAVIADDDILRFARGASAGECLHAVFERVDFGDTATWPAAIADALRLHPQAPPGSEAAAREPTMLANMLADVLHTSLPSGLQLAAVARSRRLVELEFMLPAPQLSAGALTATLQAHGYPVPALAFGALHGWLRGFIDLVFEHGGRYYIADWKSNHLGDTPADYAGPALAQAMTEQGYHLQYLLYTVALHRHLQQRLPGYRYGQHMGGALYLFVRGMRPHWRDADGAATGVFAHRPSAEVIHQLAALLAPRQEAA